MSFRLPRPPKTDEELWWVIKAMFGVELPRVRVCENHVSPFDAVAHAYFGKEPNFAVWYASRGSGKSLALAVLGLTKAFVQDIDVTILGGSMTQSLNVREHMRKLMASPNAPTYSVDKDQATLIQMSTGKNIKPLPASQTTVRGPHPPLQLLDECLVGSTLIDTPVGPRRIDRVTAGDTVSAWNGVEVVDRQVLAARQTGVRPTLRVELADGTAVSATANHPFLTTAGWVRADALHDGHDVLVVPPAADRARWWRQEKEPDRTLSDLLESRRDGGEEDVHVHRLRRSVLGDSSPWPRAVQLLFTSGPSRSGKHVPGLRGEAEAEVRALPAVLAGTSVLDRDDRADGTGARHGAQDQGAGLSSRGADGAAAGPARAVVRTLRGLPALDPGLRAARASVGHRGARVLLARPAERGGPRCAQARGAGGRRLDSAVRPDRRDASVVAVRRVVAGPVQSVYNLTVEQEHTYLANGVVVHNCDEMDLAIYNASLGQAMEQTNVHGTLVEEYIVASSTWQNPEGTFSTIMEDAREKGMPIFSWCYKELIKSPANPHGWMSQRFIDNKRKAVSAQMFHTEYDLNEPNAGSRAIDLDKVEQYFLSYGEPLVQIHKGNGDHDVYVWEKPGDGLYAVGADWAKEKDKTVIAVVRYDVMPHRLVKLTRVNRRPWDFMIDLFNADVKAYQAVGEHDGTGIGNVVNDYVENQSSTNKFVMIGRARTELLLNYITAFEHGHYELPKIPANTDFPGVVADPLYRAHRSVTVADVYAPGKWNTHLPDDVAAMALAHRAVTRGGTPVEAQGVARSQTPRDVDKPFHVKPDGGASYVQDGVTIVDERYDVSEFVIPAGEMDSWSATGV